MMEKTSTSVNKYISNTGICSRREADNWITAGRIKINGKLAQKGNRVFENDRVTVDGKPLKSPPKMVYLAFHKPPGITCTTDSRDKSNINSYINFPQRIFPVGRLDKSSSGLIIMTNDGDIVNQILRVEHNHEKEYVVTVDQPITKYFIRRMSTGLPILGQVTKKCKVQQISQFAFRIILTQGLNRQIRRMCEYLQFKVMTLKRTRILNINLEDLPVGKWRHLDSKELAILKETINYSEQ